MAYSAAFSLGLGTSQTGLALRATLTNSAGTPDASLRDIATGFTEFGAGNYQWYYSSVPDSQQGAVVFHVGDIGVAADFSGVTVKAAAAINPEDANNPWILSPRTLTQSAAQVAAIVEGTTVTVTRGDTLTIALTGLGSLTGNTDIWFSAKRSRQDSDDDAQIRISRLNGIQRLNGAAYGTSGDGSITVDDAAAGNITITIQAAASRNLQLVENGVYDIQVSDASSQIFTRSIAKWVVNADITKLITNP